MYKRQGPVRLATGEMSVRSTSSSVVGVALTIGAVAVLAVWWFRTSRRRRALRRADEAEPETSPSEPATPEPVATGPPGGTPVEP